MMDRHQPCLFKYGLFAALWCISFLVWGLVRLDTALRAPETRFGEPVLDMERAKNRISGFACVKPMPGAGGLVGRRISFRTLTVENGEFGFFKTALSRVAKIRDLRLFFRLPAGRGPGCTGVDGQPGHSPGHTAPADNSAKTGMLPDLLFSDISWGLQELVGGLLRGIEYPDRRWRINIDTANITQLLVNGFRLELVDATGSVLEITSKRAAVSYASSKVLLRGHVIIRTPGKTLESNYVEWDPENRHFTAREFYVLNCGGKKSFGESICFDGRLNRMETERITYKQEETRKCHAKLRL
jgi:hypothetical protein